LNGRETIRVLVVTSDPLVTQAAQYGFPSNVEVVLARDAREAQRVMQSMVPSAVLIDIHTGSAGGYALSRDMSQDTRLSSIPIMMLLERDQDLWLARQARARVARTKPIEVGDLVTDLMALVSQDGPVAAS
jgi:DNA-binding response OmpR family regulator